MEEKFDINTLFRVVIPGYVFILVIFSLRSELFQDDINVPALTLVGLPLGFLMYSLHRCFLYLFGCENRLEKKDLAYITKHKGVYRRGDENKKDFKKKDFFYYAASVDYLLLFSGKCKELNKHIRFLYTRMHTSSTIGISIILSFFFVVLLPCSYSSIIPSLLKSVILILWIITVILLFYLSIATAERILWWRRLVIDNNLENLQDLLKQKDILSKT